MKQSQNLTVPVVYHTKLKFSLEKMKETKRERRGGKELVVE